jgi:DNA-binding MarR family transcriptional regulator
MASKFGYVKSLFDIESDNFELYFQNQLSAITDAGRQKLPADINAMLFKQAGKINESKVRKLGFIPKLFILWRALKKRVWIVVENEESGMSPEEFLELQKEVRRRDYGVPKTEGLKAQAMFITGNRELSNTFEYLNNLSASPAYNYLLKTKNFKSTKASTYLNEMNYIVRFIRHYEANKKKWVGETGLSIPEFLILIYLYDKGEINGAPIYRSYFRRAFQSSPAKIKSGFRLLQSKGLMVKHGQTSNSKMEITPMGRTLINSILNKYALNC